MIFYSI